MRTVAALNDAGFTGAPPLSPSSHAPLTPAPEITMYETLLRPHQVDVAPALPSVAAVSAQLKRAEARREEKRLRQIAQAHRGNAAAAKRKREDAAPAAGSPSPAGKRVKTAEGEEAEAPADAEPKQEQGEGQSAVVAAEGQQEVEPEQAQEPAKVSLSKAFAEVRGHTSYLTFAVLLPASVRALAESADASGAATPQAAAA